MNRKQHEFFGECARIFVALVCVGLILLSVITSPFFLSALFTTFYENEFDRVQMSSSESDVRELMGPPDRLGRCKDGNFEKDKMCVSEWVYFHFFAPTDEWWIFFDKDGRVIEKYHAISP